MCETLRALQSFQSIPADIIDIIESYGEYKIASGKLKWKIPSPPGSFDLKAIRYNVAIAQNSSSNHVELHICKLSPCDPNKSGKTGQVDRSEKIFECSFQTSPFHRFMRSFRFNGVSQHVRICRNFIYAYEIYIFKNRDYKFDFHVFDHNGSLHHQFTITNNFGELTDIQIIAHGGYLWFSEFHDKLYRCNLRIDIITFFQFSF